MPDLHVNQATRCFQKRDAGESHCKIDLALPTFFCDSEAIDWPISRVVADWAGLGRAMLSETTAVEDGSVFQPKA